MVSKYQWPHIMQADVHHALIIVYAAKFHRGEDGGIGRGPVQEGTVHAVLHRATESTIGSLHYGHFAAEIKRELSLLTSFSILSCLQ